MRRGWFRESYRHYLAAKGVSTRRYAALTAGGRFVERLYAGGEERRRRIAVAAPEVARTQLALRTASLPRTAEQKAREEREIREMIETAKAQEYSRRGTIGQQKKKMSEVPSRAFEEWKPEHSAFVLENIESKIAESEAKQQELQQQLGKEEEFSKKDALRKELVVEGERVDALRKQAKRIRSAIDKLEEGQGLSPVERKELGNNAIAYRRLFVNGS